MFYFILQICVANNLLEITIKKLFFKLRRVCHEQVLKFDLNYIIIID